MRLTIFKQHGWNDEDEISCWKIWRSCDDPARKRNSFRCILLYSAILPFQKIESCSSGETQARRRAGSKRLGIFVEQAFSDNTRFWRWEGLRQSSHNEVWSCFILSPWSTLIRVSSGGRLDEGWTTKRLQRPSYEHLFLWRT